LRKPHNFHNPGSFDYEKQLRGRGILVQGTISTASDIVLIRRDCGSPLKSALEKARNKLRTIIEENATTPEREVLQALLLGETKQIPQSVRDGFTKTGTSHILAISGLHVGLVASFFLFLTLLIMKSSTYLLLRFNVTRIATFFALLPILLYALMAGLGISVIRATIMILAFLMAILLRKERDLFNTLALAALLILLISPVALFDISFQLSFAAVASLIFIAPFIAHWFPEKQNEGVARAAYLTKKAGRTLLLFVLISLTATLGTLPLIARYFNGISTVTLLANCIAVPLMGMLTLSLSMAAMLAAFILPMLAAYLVKLAALSLIPSLAAINFLASLPFSYLTVTTPSLPEIIFYYLLLMALVIMVDRKKDPSHKTEIGHLPRLLPPAVCGLALLYFIGDITYLSLRDRYRSQLQVTVVDVGQGNATLVRCPAGKDILIDGGGSHAGSFDLGKHVLAPYLWRERIKQLEAVVLTHPHPDHLQGLLYVLENIPVREVWTNGYPAATELYAKFLKILKEKGIRQRTMGKGTKALMINGVSIAILSPSPSLPKERHEDEIDNFAKANDRSLVLRLTLGEISFLLPGDISGLMEQRLVEEEMGLKSAVLLVPHHGSSTSATAAFLKAVQPRAAIISCGRDNVFHFPHPRVLQRLAAVPARVYRTDRDGAVTAITDGQDLQITTVLGNR